MSDDFILAFPNETIKRWGREAVVERYLRMWVDNQRQYWTHRLRLIMPHMKYFDHATEHVDVLKWHCTFYSEENYKLFLQNSVVEFYVEREQFVDYRFGADEWNCIYHDWFSNNDKLPY